MVRVNQENIRYIFRISKCPILEFSTCSQSWRDFLHVKSTRYLHKLEIRISRRRQFLHGLIWMTRQIILTMCGILLDNRIRGKVVQSILSWWKSKSIDVKSHGHPRTTIATSKFSLRVFCKKYIIMVTIISDSRFPSQMSFYSYRYEDLWSRVISSKHDSSQHFHRLCSSNQVLHKEKF